MLLLLLLRNQSHHHPPHNLHDIVVAKQPDSVVLAPVFDREPPPRITYLTEFVADELPLRFVQKHISPGCCRRHTKSLLLFLFSHPSIHPLILLLAHSPPTQSDVFMICLTPRICAPHFHVLFSLQQQQPYSGSSLVEQQQRQRKLTAIYPPPIWCGKRLRRRQHERRLRRRMLTVSHPVAQFSGGGWLLLLPPPLSRSSVVSFNSSLPLVLCSSSAIFASLFACVAVNLFFLFHTNIIYLRQFSST